MDCEFLNAAEMKSRTGNPCIVAVVGSPGAGKSTFIRMLGATALGGDKAAPMVGSGAEPATAEPALYQIPNTKVVLIDAPGITNTRHADRELVRQMDSVLGAVGAGITDVSVILYLHAIDDRRMPRSTRRNLEMLGAAIGPNGLNHCSLITTKWSCERRDMAVSHEHELLTDPDLWMPLVDGGVGYERFRDTRQSAMRILTPLCPTGALAPIAADGGSAVGSGLSIDKLADDLAMDDIEHRKEVSQVVREAAAALHTRQEEFLRWREAEMRNL